MTHPALTHSSPDRGPSMDDTFFTLFRRQKSGIKCEISHQMLATNSPVNTVQSVGQFSRSVQSLSRVRLFVIPWSAACQAPLPITNSQRVLTLTSIESVMPPTISSSVMQNTVQAPRNRPPSSKDYRPVHSFLS